MISFKDYRYIVPHISANGLANYSIVLFKQMYNSNPELWEIAVKKTTAFRFDLGQDIVFNDEAENEMLRGVIVDNPTYSKRIIQFKGMASTQELESILAKCSREEMIPPTLGENKHSWDKSKKYKRISIRTTPSKMADDIITEAAKGNTRIIIENILVYHFLYFYHTNDTTAISDMIAKLLEYDPKSVILIEDSAEDTKDFNQLSLDELKRKVNQMLKE